MLRIDHAPRQITARARLLCVWHQVGRTPTMRCLRDLGRWLLWAMMPGAAVAVGVAASLKSDWWVFRATGAGGVGGLVSLIWKVRMDTDRGGGGGLRRAHCWFLSK